MEQTKFHMGIMKIITGGADVKDPEKLANTLYFYIKQHPKELKIDEAWVKILKNAKTVLHSLYEWDMKEIHKFVVKLHNLTKYMEKSS